MGGRRRSNKQIFISMYDKCYYNVRHWYYKVRRLLQRATEQCSGSKDEKPAFQPYRYHLGLVKPQRLASLQKQKSPYVRLGVDLLQVDLS